MFEQAFKNIDDALWKESGCTTELDYTEQTSWLLFLKYLDGLERDKAAEAALEGKPYRHILDTAYRWESWATPCDQATAGLTRAGVPYTVQAAPVGSLAQVQVGMRQRHQELVVYRTLGAGKRLLRMTLWSEFALLGLVAGLVAAIGAETALAVLQTKVFDFPWEPDWRLWLILPLSGAVLLSLCGGWLGTRLLKGKALFRQFAS